MSEQESTVSHSAPALATAASEAWARIERARHPQRPYPMELIERIFTDFSEIHGDRAFGDDEAVACGMARLDGEEVMVIGNRKGGTTKERVRRNFGMPHPEGYRKALRSMRIAEKFGRPVVSFIDLPGAFPGLGAEERGQAEAIARNILEMSRLRVPTISVISGEGGSGEGAKVPRTDLSATPRARCVSPASRRTRARCSCHPPCATRQRRSRVARHSSRRAIDRARCGRFVRVSPARRVLGACCHTRRARASRSGTSVQLACGEGTARGPSAAPRAAPESTSRTRTPRSPGLRSRRFPARRRPR